MECHRGCLLKDDERVTVKDGDSRNYHINNLKVVKNQTDDDDVWAGWE